MDVVIKIAQLLLSLSILVLLHELGHFIPAKLFKTKVERFYLFFNPWFSLFKIKKGETEYGIGWLPLGGYVKIAGMIDESMDKEQMKQPAQPWEFRSKPAWQRLIIMIGGVTVNVILAMVIYSFMAYIWGIPYVLNNDVHNGIRVVDSLGYKMGFRDGDHLKSVDGNPVVRFDEVIYNQIVFDEAKNVQVERNEEIINIPVEKDHIKQLIHSKARLFTYRLQFLIDSIHDGLPAHVAGLKRGDRVIGIDTISTPFFSDFRQVIDSFKNKETTIKIIRGQDTISKSIQLTKRPIIGASCRHPIRIERFSLLASIPAGISEGMEMIRINLLQFKFVFSRKYEGYKSIGSFITIGDMFPSTWDWHQFWKMTAFLSVVLAIMNLLPIPALDGGHVMFLMYEMITGKKPGEKFMEVAQVIGMVLLLSLMVYALGNDIFKNFLK